MPVRVKDYWTTPRVFRFYHNYIDSVVYPCIATTKYWEQGETVMKARDGQYYTEDEYTAWYGRYAAAFWMDAIRRSQSESLLEELRLPQIASNVDPKYQ